MRVGFYHACTRNSIELCVVVQVRDGFYYTLEQQELVQLLVQQSTDNADQIDLEQAIQVMSEVEEVKLEI